MNRVVNEIFDAIDNMFNDCINDEKKEEEKPMKNIITEDNIIICTVCGQAVPLDNAHYVEDEWYCNDCYDETFAECYECGEIIRMDEAFQDEDGDYYCESCFDDLFAICNSCGEYHRKYDMYFVESEDRWYCDDCISRNHTQCDRCSSWVSNYDIYTVFVDNERNTEQWCDSCCDFHTHTCEECEEVYSEDVEFDDDYCCPNCSTEWRHQSGGDIKRFRAPRGVASYSFKPDPCFCVTDEQNIDDLDNIPLGFELEVDKPHRDTDIDDAADFVNDMTKYTYVKHDGSLSNGMEIVSHPATIEYHMDKKEVWETVFNQLITDMGFKSHDARTCGLHVHISLAALEHDNPNTVNNMLFLLDHYWSNFVKFSRRTEEQLNHWARRYSTYHGDYENLKKIAKGTRDRYYALNLQNKHTVEIRMFRGTLNLETFYATLQFVDVFARKCREITDLRVLQSLSWEELVKSDYPELNAYLKRRGLAGSSDEVEEADEAIRAKEEARLRAEREEEERREREREEQRRLAREAEEERVRRYRERIDELHRDFPFGTRVRCISPADGQEYYVGHTGTIINHSDGLRLDAHVHFDLADDDNHGHDGYDVDGNHVHSHVWYCEHECLEPFCE